MRPLVALTALAIGCTAPDYGNGHLQCAPSRVCPSGFYCAGDDHCWRNGSGPPDGDLAMRAVNDLGSPPDDLPMFGGDLGIAPSTCGSLMGVLFCDGFETPIIGSGWGASGSNGLPSRDTSRAFRGNASLHSHINGAPAMAGPVAVLHRSDIFPITGTIYARVWVYFTSGLPPSFEQFLNFADSSMTGYSVATDSGKVTLDDYAAGVYQSSATTMPLDRWACVQFEVEQGNPMAAIHVRVDGQVLSDLPQTAAATVAVNLSVGLDFYGNTAVIPQYDAWFDELIIDNKPTTCDE
ncbi:MAG TPA: hypothetical protein VF334_16040 [Polyangia bacterium]